MEWWSRTESERNVKAYKLALLNLINPLTPKLYSFQTTFSICMPTTHHIFISVRALTPKLSPSALAAIISRLVTLTTPTH